MNKDDINWRRLREIKKLEKISHLFQDAPPFLPGSCGNCRTKKKICALAEILTSRLSLDVIWHCHNNRIFTCKSSPISSFLTDFLVFPVLSKKLIELAAGNRLWIQFGPARARRLKPSRDTARPAVLSNSACRTEWFQTSHTHFIIFKLYFTKTRACPQLAKANLGGPCLNSRLQKYTLCNCRA